MEIERTWRERLAPVDWGAVATYAAALALWAGLLAIIWWEAGR